MSETSGGPREERVESEQLLDGALLKVYRDRVRLPDGDEAVREWIKHPGASAVVSLFEDGSTVLIRQFRYPPQKTFIEVPAGKLDVEGEDPADVARRELEEETGWKATTISEIGAFYPCIGYSNEIIYLYLAEGLVQGTVNMQHGEFMEPFRLPFREAVEMAMRGTIADMKSALGILLVDLHLQRNGKIY